VSHIHQAGCASEARTNTLTAHEDADVLGFGVGRHFLELRHRGSAGLLEKNVGAAAVDDGLEQAGVVGGAPRDERQFRGAARWALHGVHRRVEIHRAVRVLEHAELRSGRRPRALPHEPRLHHVRQLPRGDVSVEQLLGVIPAHASSGNPAPDEHDVALSARSRRELPARAHRRNGAPERGRGSAQQCAGGRGCERHGVAR
jgi:hypothetical protein